MPSLVRLLEQEHCAYGDSFGIAFGGLRRGYGRAWGEANPPAQRWNALSSTRWQAAGLVKRDAISESHSAAKSTLSAAAETSRALKRRAVRPRLSKAREQLLLRRAGYYR